MRIYTIVTNEYWNGRLGGRYTFLTKARDIKSALRKLLDKSNDFKNLVNKEESKLQITITKG